MQQYFLYKHAINLEAHTKGKRRKLEFTSHFRMSKRLSSCSQAEGSIATRLAAPACCLAAKCKQAA